jgi:hypothetical protein
MQQIIIKAKRPKYIKHVCFVGKLSFQVLLITITLNGSIGAFDKLIAVMTAADLHISQAFW